MATYSVEFRCENCGLVFSVIFQKGTKAEYARCPDCDIMTSTKIQWGLKREGEHYGG